MIYKKLYKCTKNSKRLFELFGLLNEFLSKDLSLWEEDESFKEARDKIKGLAVVNERAECGVALVQDLNRKLTTGEEQLQFLLKVVANHRRQFLDCNKKTVIVKTRGQ